MCDSHSVLSDSLEPLDCSLPNSSVHGIPQARILDWIAIPFSRGSSQPRSPALQADSLPSEPPGKPFGSIPSKPKVQNLHLSKYGLMALQLTPNLVSFCDKIPQFLGILELSVAFGLCSRNLFVSFSNFERAHHLVTNKLYLNRDSSHCYCCCSVTQSCLTLFDPMDWLLSS